LKSKSLLYYSDNISNDVQAVFSLNPSKHSRKEIARKLENNTDNIAIPEQVHSTAVEFARLPGIYSPADGLVTTNSNILLTLKVADCVPVFLYEPLKRIIGLVHSGWRGTVKNIVSNAIKLMQKNGAESRYIRCFLGPAIGKCCYEVDWEVSQYINDGAKVKMDYDKWKVDLHEQIRYQLTELGVPTNSIEASNICTYESPECHSYRRDGDNAGRMYAFLSLK
jgi:hypothetical protein